jgi:pilus assembly protein Flp/PilA
MAVAAQRVRERMVRGRDAERGQGLVEYSLILILIAVVVVLIVGIVGKQVANVYSNVSSGLST